MGAYGVAVCTLWDMRMVCLARASGKREFFHRKASPVFGRYFSSVRQSKLMMCPQENEEVESSGVVSMRLNNAPAVPTCTSLLTINCSWAAAVQQYTAQQKLCMQ